MLPGGGEKGLVYICRLAAPYVVDQGDPGGLAGDAAAAVGFDQVDHEVEHGAEGRGGGDAGVADHQLVGRDGRGGMALGELVGEEPGRRRVAMIEETGLADQESADADGHHSRAPSVAALDLVDLRPESGQAPIEVLAGHELEAGHDQHVDRLHRAHAEGHPA